ncbi:MAG: Ig-like domain-containing protein, partial [Pirellulales bacterium]
WEDGFVAWVNGVQVAAMNAPAAPAFNSTSTGGARNEAAAIVQDVFVINLALPGLVLKPGAAANILAIQGLNDAIGSSDLLVEPELIADTATKGLWSNVATVTLSVTGPGPVAADDSAFTQVGQPVNVPVLANDVPGFSAAAIRPDTVQVTVPPANGTTQVDPATGDIAYTPNAGFFGDDVFTYEVRDAAMVGGSQTRMVMTRGSVWKYLSGPDQGTAWTGRTFNDSAWLSGPTEIGFGDGGEATVITPGGAGTHTTVYFRSTFNLPSAAAVQELDLFVRYDDGMAVYINGQEVDRQNLAAGATYTAYAPATLADDGTTYYPYIKLRSANQLGMLVDGTNTIAIEVHQQSAGSSDISFDCEIVVKEDTPTGNASNPAQVHVHVNAPPVVVNDAISVGPQGTTGTLPNSITFNPLANDSDPDSSPSTPAGSFGINPRTVTITQPPPQFKGTVSVNPTTGFITYTAVGLLTPQTVTFGYTVKDYEGKESTQATVTATVVVVRPQVMNDAGVTPESRTVGETSVTINVLANDTKGDLTINTSSVTIDVLALPSNGTVVVNSTAGTITYTPNVGFRDQFDSFGYKIYDLGGNASSTATVTVDVFSRAIAQEDGFALPQGATSVTIPIADILANDYYPSSFQPELVIVPNSQTKGTPVINSSGGVQQSVTFTPTAGATGVAGFTYYLRDKDPNPTRPNSNNARVNIALGAVNINGTVYVDVNRNDQHETGEQLVPDATIVLTRVGDPNFRRTTITNSLGQYSFASTSAGVLPPDTYTITQVQPALYLDFPTGAVNAYTAALTEPSNPGYDFREWTVNPQFFTMLANYGGGFLASQQPVSLAANSLVVPYDLGWNGAFTAKATYDPALGPVTVKLYNSAGSIVANSATNPSSTPGNSVINYSASASQPLVLVVSGTNPNVSIQSPSLGTTAGDTTPPYVVSTSLSSSTWSPAFVANLASHQMGAAGYNVAAGETLPWQGLNRISMRFTEPVVVAHDDLRLWGVAVEDYRRDVGIQSFEYDPLTFTATWTLTAPIAADQLRVGLSDSVRDTWGNRVGGTGYERLFNVLPGGAASLGDVLARQFSSIGSDRYAPQFDLDGNGVINFVDAIAMRNAASTLLPAGTPGSGTTSTSSPQAPAAVIVAASRDAGLDVGTATRRSSTAAAPQRLIARTTRAAAAADAAFDTSADAQAGGSNGTSSLTAIRARRAARTVDQSVASLGGTL